MPKLHQGAQTRGLHESSSRFAVQHSPSALEAYGLIASLSGSCGRAPPSIGSQSLPPLASIEAVHLPSPNQSSSLFQSAVDYGTKMDVMLPVKGHISWR